MKKKSKSNINKSNTTTGNYKLVIFLIKVPLKKIGKTNKLTDVSVVFSSTFDRQTRHNSCCRFRLSAVRLTTGRFISEQHSWTHPHC